MAKRAVKKSTGSRVKRVVKKVRAYNASKRKPVKKMGTFGKVLTAAALGVTAYHAGRALGRGARNAGSAWGQNVFERAGRRKANHWGFENAKYAGRNRYSAGSLTGRPKLLGPKTKRKFVRKKHHF